MILRKGVQIMTEEEMMMEETTEQTTEQETVTETETETTTEIITTLSTSDPEIIETLPDNSENIIHQLFFELGVNLDYTPVNRFQVFSMSLQFLAALWFIWWFVKYLFTVLRGFLGGRNI